MSCAVDSLRPISPIVLKKHWVEFAKGILLCLENKQRQTKYGQRRFFLKRPRLMRNSSRVYLTMRAILGFIAACDLSLAIVRLLPSGTCLHYPEWVLWLLRSGCNRPISAFSGTLLHTVLSCTLSAPLLLSWWEILRFMPEYMPICSCCQSLARSRLRNSTIFISLGQTWFNKGSIKKKVIT